MQPTRARPLLRPSPSQTAARRLLRAGSKLVVSLLLFASVGCVYHRHSVGLGATGTGEQVARQYYVLFGLIAANEVDAQRMADGLTSYEIETEYSFFDMAISPLLFPLTIVTRTVRVRT